MKTNLRRGIFHLATCVLILFFILLLSCATTSTSVPSLEGSEFEENLPGMWEGKWNWGSYSGKENIKINNVEGNNVQLTGHVEGKGWTPTTEKVDGRIESSTLLLTWGGGCMDKLTMKRDKSNNLILGGPSLCEADNTTRVQLKKIE